MKVFPPFQLDTTNQCLWRITGEWHRRTNHAQAQGVFHPWNISGESPRPPSSLNRNYSTLSGATPTSSRKSSNATSSICERSSATIRNHRYFSKPCLGAATNSLLRFRTPKPASLTQHCLESDWLDGDRPLDELDEPPPPRNGFPAPDKSSSPANRELGKTALVEEFQRRAGRSHSAPPRRGWTVRRRLRRQGTPTTLLSLTR